MRTTSSTRGLSSTLATLAAKCLNVPAGSIAQQVPLTRYGLDSLATIELTAAIENALGRRLPESVLIEHPDLGSLERYLTANSDGGNPQVDSREQMRSDSVLPPDIGPSAHAASPISRDTVLLTGATGFLGGHLLNSLLKNTRMSVYCLARGADRSCVATRLRQSMERYRIWDPAFETRLKIILGDVALPQLGLESETYSMLCEEVDAIYHSAAIVDWVRPYGALRKANVLGTLDLLRIACATKPKPFHFVSTAAVCYSTWGSRDVQETDDVYPYLNGLHLGYAHSKSVAEALVVQAGERGLPVTIHRPSLLTGSRASGVSNADDLLSRLFRGMIQMEAAPDLDWSLDCCPVDYVADAIVHLTTEHHESRVFHLVNPDPRHWRELILWMNLFGYRVHLLPYREWLRRLKEEAVAPGHPLRGLLPFFSNQPAGEGGLTLPELYEDTRRSRIRCSRTREALRGSSIGSPSVNARLLDSYFRDYIATRFLPRAGSVRRRRSADRKRVLDAGLFTASLRRNLDNKNLVVHKMQAVKGESPHSIIAELSSWKYGSQAGLDRYQLQIVRAEGMPETIDVVVKRKAKDEHVIDVAKQIASLCSPQLGRAFARCSHSVGLVGCHRRELGIYNHVDERFKRYTPRLYGSLHNERRGDWVLVLEDISGLELLDTAEDVSGWQRECIEAAILGLARLHAIWYGRDKELLIQPWLGPVITAQQRVGMQDLWMSLAEHAQSRFAQSIGAVAKTLQNRMIRHVGPRWRLLERLPRTLIHNDFNPRNIALRREGRNLHLCAYDWELATVGAPQHDLAEFLCFTLKPRLDRTEVMHYVDLHRSALEQAVNRPIDPAAWELGFRLSLHDFLMDRFAMYAMIDSFRPQRFLKRLISTWHALYEAFPFEEDCMR
jgi:thioester reductase-like protein